jgi:hypothetical protein
MFQDKPWVVRVVLVLCVVGLAATFPYLKTTVKLDTLDHCSVTFDSKMQVAYISVDVSLFLFHFVSIFSLIFILKVFINVLLSILFGFAIWKHISGTDKTWSSYSKLNYILTCDVRASFVDTLAQLIKLTFNATPILISSQTVFVSHVMDWIKPITAHWFVSDVVGQSIQESNPGSSVGRSISQTGHHSNPGGNQVSSTISNSGNSLSPPVLVSIRRKSPSDTYSIRKSDMKKPTPVATNTALIKSTETLRSNESLRESSEEDASGVSSAESSPTSSNDGNLNQK